MRLRTPSFLIFKNGGAGVTESWCTSVGLVKSPILTTANAVTQAHNIKTTTHQMP